MKGPKLPKEIAPEDRTPLVEWLLSVIEYQQSIIEEQSQQIEQLKGRVEQVEEALKKAKKLTWIPQLKASHLELPSLAL